MSTVSIIVPVYKVEQYLHRCVDSILAQTFTDFELILVDDGSPDNCPAICDEYAEKDNRVHVIHQENGGLSAARNAGIDWAFANSDSQWINFVDSDDWVHPEYLERLRNAAGNSGLVSICGYIKTSGEVPSIDEESLKVSIHDTDDFYINHNINAVVAWGKLYPKKDFQNIRYPIGKIHEDEFTTYKLLFQKPKVAFIPAPMYCYFQNPTGIMNSPWKPARLSIIDAYEERLDFFNSRGDLKMYMRTTETYVWVLTGCYNELQKDDVNRSYAAIFSKKLRSILLRYHKDLPIDIFGGAYEAAFPWMMQVYWLCLSRWNRLQRLQILKKHQRK